MPHGLAIDPAFAHRLSGPLLAESIQTLQVNVGHQCNLQCGHCHVEAGPASTEVMPRTIMEQCLEVLRANPIPNIDITGGQSRRCTLTLNGSSGNVQRCSGASW